MTLSNYARIVFCKRTFKGLLIATLVYCTGCYGPPRSPPYAQETYTVFLDGNPANRSLGNAANRTVLKSLPSIPAEEAGYEAIQGNALILLYRKDTNRSHDAGLFLNGKRFGTLSSKQRIVVSVPAGKARVSVATMTDSPLEEEWDRIESYARYSGGGQEFDAVEGELYAFEARLIFGIDAYPAYLYGREPDRALGESSRFELVR